MSYTSSRAPFLHTTFYGGIDLGTNTCRLLIAKPYWSKNKVCFSAVSSFSKMILFGEDMDATSSLSSAAMDRAFDALSECVRRLDFYQVSHRRAVATAACRRAQNGQDFVTHIKNTLDLTLNIIPFEEEAELAVAGCVDVFAPFTPYGIVFDIGGGSTEVVWIKLQSDTQEGGQSAASFRVLDCLSLPYGVLTLQDSAYSLEAKREVGKTILYSLQAFSEKNNIPHYVSKGQVQMVGASGTVTTLAAMILKLPKYNRARVHEVRLSSHDLSHLITTLWRMSPEERKDHPCIGEQRSHFIMGGVTLFQAIYEAFQLDSLVVADRGVREGLVRRLFERAPCPFLFPAPSVSHNNLSINCNFSEKDLITPRS